MTTRPRLKLVMIVKNEFGDIVRTLASVKPHIDAWSILDTGSTDGTQDQIRELLADVPGALHEGPFVDFATTRNAAIDLAGTDCEFLLFLDAEDVLQGGEALREFLPIASAMGHGAYYLTMAMNGTHFSTARLSRSAAGWRYRGVVHEVLQGPAGEIPQAVAPGVTIVQDRSSDSLARTRARWERDLALLMQATSDDPADARGTFYLGQTYECLGRREEAIAAYRRRVALGGWIEEVYTATMRIARLSGELGHPWPEVQQHYLDAFAIAPHRAEPLCAIARHYVDAKAYAVGFVFAQRAYQLPYPTQDRLFVDAEVYAWRAADLVGTTAWYVGEYALGEEATRRALAALPGNPGLVDTLGFYERRRGAEG